MQKIIKIENLDCANCAREMGEELEELEGIVKANVDFVGQKVFLDYESDEALEKAKYLISHFEEVRIVETEKDIVIKIENLDCANCAREMGEELEELEGIVKANVDFVGQKVYLTYETNEALNKAKYLISHFEEVRIVEDGKAVVIKIRNLDCANCARELGEELEEIDGVKSANVDFVGQKVSLEYESLEALKKAKYLISHFEEVEIVEEGEVKKDSKLKEILSIAFSTAFFIPALILHLVGGYEWWSFGLFLASFLSAGWSVVWSVVKNIGKSFKGGFRFGVLFDENTLMLIASVGAFAIGENMEGAAVMLLYQIGELLQSIAVGSSRNAITKLVELKSESAIRIENGEQKEVSPDELVEGDILFIRKGDKISADGVIVEGETSLDTKSLTGESALKEVSVGEEVLAGCVNEGAPVKVKVLRPVSESAVAKILNMVENSSAQKAKPEKFITRFARYYTPIVVLMAVLLAVVPPLFTHEWTRWITSALNFLVVSCPCAIIISVPLTYFSGVGTLARLGVLTKGAVYLDTLASVGVVAFDKTGTLTEGKFSVVKVNGDKRALDIAVAVERNSSHPLAQAFAEFETPYETLRCEEVSGKGLKAIVGGKFVYVGNYRMMRDCGVKAEEVDSVSSVIYVAEEGKVLGTIEIDDALKADAKEAIEALKKLGVKKTVMLTGDNRRRAEKIASALSLDEVKAELMPEQKLECAKELKKSGTLLYVGDGINDTPVMAESDIACSMGALGSDAAIEASDLVLVSDNLSALPKAVKGAKKTKKIVMQNIVFSIAVKVALMVLSVMGVLPLWVAVLGDVGVMLLAVVNSMRMRFKIK